MSRTIAREIEEGRADSAVYLPKSYTQPQTHMNTEEAGELVRMLSLMPPTTGFLFTNVITPVHAPQTFGGYSAKVILPGGGTGEANANNPAIAFRTAWARAHMSAAEMIMPKVPVA